jgi:hypothetical protein
VLPANNLASAERPPPGVWTLRISACHRLRQGPQRSIDHHPAASDFGEFDPAFLHEMPELGGPIAQEVGAELLPSSRDCSETHVAEMAERAAADSRPFVVLYFSDFDPGGWGMPIRVARKFQAPIWRCKCTRSR